MQMQIHKLGGNKCNGKRKGRKKAQLQFPGQSLPRKIYCPSLVPVQNQYPYQILQMEIEDIKTHHQNTVTTATWLKARHHNSNINVFLLVPAHRHNQ
jgi:hypothetical protein